MSIDAREKELEEIEVQCALESLRVEYEKTKNPVYAMEAFLIANERYDLDIAIPDWILHWICNAFREYWSSSGQKKLETSLGFQYGKGKAPSKDFKKYFIHGRDNSLLWHMCILRRFGDLNILAAAKLVINRFIETGAENMEEVSPETLRTKYIKRKWTDRERTILDDMKSYHKKSLSEFILKEHGINPNTDKNNCSNSSEKLSEIELLIYRNKWSGTKSPI